MITFSCDQCGRTLSSSDELAGMQCRCPNCQKVQPVPQGGADVAPTGTVCPGCGAAVAAAQAICVGCGLDLRSGERVATSVSAPREPATPVHTEGPIVRAADLEPGAPGGSGPAKLMMGLPAWARIAVPAGAGAILIAVVALVALGGGSGEEPPGKEPVTRPPRVRAKEAGPARPAPGGASPDEAGAAVALERGPKGEPNEARRPPAEERGSAASPPGPGPEEARAREAEAERAWREELRRKEEERQEREERQRKEEERRRKEEELARKRPVEGVDSINTRNYANTRLEFYYYIPSRVVVAKDSSHPVLVCIPGLSGSGRAFANATFKGFAEREGFIIVAPSFQWDEKNWATKTSYQYPSVWSGNALVAMIDRLRRQQGVSTSKFYLYGFSAGAQFALRFALARPGLCAASSAHASGGTVIVKSRIGVKFHVSVGRTDRPRVPKAEAFRDSAKRCGVAVTYKLYPGGHVRPREQIEDSFAFFSAVKSARGGRSASTRSGPAAAEERARRLWEMAKNLLANDMKEDARTRLEEIVKKHPESVYADKARRALADM